MKSEMGMEEIEAVLDKIWDLHDKLSDAIHSISRAHFLYSVRSLTKSDNNKKLYDDVVAGDDNRSGFVFVKDFQIDDTDSAIQEAKSLNAIRTALENLEDHLEIFHTVQIQQRAERDAAIAQLQQSQIILALRLAQHHGKRYKVIDEALAFVRDVQDSSQFVSTEDLYGTPISPSGENLKSNGRQHSNMLRKAFISSFNFAKKFLKFDHMGSILSTAPLLAVNMIAMLYLHQIAFTDHSQRNEDNTNSRRNTTKNARLDVFSARG